MKKLIAIAVIALASFVGANAQSAQSQNQFVVGYNFATSDVSVARLNGTRFNSDTDSHGITLGYTRFTKSVGDKVGILGLTGEVTANFDANEANQVTVMAGPTLQARNSSYVQPYARVLAGVSRTHINRANIADVSDASFAVDGGVGLDFSSKGSRNAFRLGFDVVNYGFNGERTYAYKATAGIRF